MEDLFETITRGNVTEVKVVLASVVAALAIYQVLLMAVCYGRLRIGFLQPPAAGWAHRAVGDSIVVVSVVGARAEDPRRPPLALRLAVPAVLGITVLVLFGLTWLTSAGDFLLDD